MFAALNSVALRFKNPAALDPFRAGEAWTAARRAMPFEAV
jgi:hypothetical protein